MGTRGYKVYRYKGWYFVHYNHWDSYPSGLGLDILRSIPVDRAAFDMWVRQWRDDLERELEEQGLGDGGTDVQISDDDGRYCITRTKPLNDVFIEWVYEIDFDNMIFHVDNRPMFPLKCMPSEDIFESCIGFNHYGQRAPDPVTPAEHHYVAHLSLPKNQAHAQPRLHSKVAHTLIEHGFNIPIHQLLDTNETLTARDTQRESFLQILVGDYLRSDEAGSHVPWLPSYADREDIPPELCAFALGLLRLAFSPHLSYSSLVESSAVLLSPLWLRADTFLWIATDLSSPQHIRAALESSLFEV
ncbi:hypothetical protein CALCODRAFT_329174 [Calocera cornea HHB12733]|uniref:Uncharacterized protein n=1 Tax=Calocera cornea HHB12733 TaxID=1353952 RepID=A0A165JIV3_9BASI|nr:hypothetical protein CALCODRAFT_329174 [Calocera cornea HHB12733]